MARKFRGSFHQKVDGKGRVSIPASFRRVVESGDPDWTDGLRPNLVIVYGLDSQKRLDCYTLNAIEDIEDRIDLMQPGSPERETRSRHPANPDSRWKKEFDSSTRTRPGTAYRAGEWPTRP